MADPVSIASLGIAVFTTGKTLATEGSFRSSSDTPSYMHSKKQSSKWGKVIASIGLNAYHPRAGIGTQNMKFRLIYDYNGHDIRNARVEPLINASSGMYSSTFVVNWRGQAHSHPKDVVSEIIFNFSGEWDPVGVGHVSFWGELLISAAKNGHNFERFTCTSEKNWVKVKK